MAIFHQWWLWIAFMFLFFVGPVSYGLGLPQVGGAIPPVHSEASWARKQAQVAISQP